MHQLTVINGGDADPLFDYLKEQAPGTLTLRSNGILQNSLLIKTVK